MDGSASSIAIINYLQKADGINGKMLGKSFRIDADKIKERFYNELIKDIKTFDGVVFQKEKKVIDIYGAVYIQAITCSNPNAWMWEAVDLSDYWMISKALDNGGIEAIREILLKIARKNPYATPNYYYYCIKHGLACEGYIEKQVSENLKNRIKSDIEAEASNIYRECREDEFMPETFDANKHKEEYLYELLDEAREAYENSDEQKEDMQEAKETVLNKWAEYSNDLITKEVIAELKGDGE